MRCFAWMVVASLPFSVQARDEAAVVQAWASEFVRRAQESPVPQGSLITYTATFPAIASLAQVEQWQREIAGKPDHPKSSLVEQELRRLTRGPDVSKRRLAWWDEKLARIGEELPLTPMKYADAGVSGQSMWSMTAAGWTASDSSTPSGKGVTYKYDALVRAEARNLAALRTGGVVSFINLDPSSATVERQGAHWKVEWLSSSASVKAQAIVRYDAAHSVVLRSSRFNITKSPPETLATFESPDWVEHPQLGWMCATLKQTEQSGEVTIFKVESVEGIERGLVEALAAVPDRSKEDPWRGTLAIAAVDDFRNDQMVRSRIDAETGKEVVTPTAFESSRQWLRHAGWFAAGLVVAMVLAVRVLRGRSAARATHAR